MRYLRLWLLFAKNRLLTNLEERWGAVFFIGGKFIRFGFVGLFLITLANQIELLQGYSRDQLLVVYLLLIFLT